MSNKTDWLELLITLLGACIFEGLSSMGMTFWNDSSGWDRAGIALLSSISGFLWMILGAQIVLEIVKRNNTKNDK